MTIAIIGAGMTGLACAALLSARGHEVKLFDKGRGPGGRMATRRLPTDQGVAAFDHGAQYFTVRDDGFRVQMQAWQAARTVARWPAAGPDAWVGTPTMNAPLKAMSADLDIRWNTMVGSILRTTSAWQVMGADCSAGPFETVVIATPAEQAAPLVAPWRAEWARRATATPALPCWTVMAAFADPLAGPDILPQAIEEEGPIGWAARNSAKPDRTGPEAWVIQANPAWSIAHLEDAPDAVLPQLLDAFARRIGPLPQVLSAAAHRWRYAKSGKEGSGALWDPALGLGICGDWLLGPRVECAWVSGTGLAASIAV